MPRPEPARSPGRALLRRRNRYPRRSAGFRERSGAARCFARARPAPHRRRGSAPRHTIRCHSWGSRSESARSMTPAAIALTPTSTASSHKEVRGRVTMNTPRNSTTTPMMSNAGAGAPSINRSTRRSCGLRTAFTGLSVTRAILSRGASARIGSRAARRLTGWTLGHRSALPEKRSRALRSAGRPEPGTPRTASSTSS